MTETRVTQSVTLTVPVKRCAFCHATEAEANACTDGSQFHVFHTADEAVEFVSRFANDTATPRTVRVAA